MKYVTMINILLLYYIAPYGAGPGMPAAPPASQFPMPSPMGFGVIIIKIIRKFQMRLLARIPKVGIQFQEHQCPSS